MCGSSLASTGHKFCTSLFVALAIAVLLALQPPGSDCFPFVLCFAGIVLTAWLDRYGLSLLGLGLSWYSIDALFSYPGPSPNVVLLRSHLVIAVVAIGLAIGVLTRLVRSARRDALEKSSEARRAMEEQRANWEGCNPFDCALETHAATGSCVGTLLRI
jgi:hypothetical protein